MELETLNVQARTSLPSPTSSPSGRGKGEGAAHGRRAGDEGAQLKQTIAGSLPLPLGEGWGEGSAFAEYGGNFGGVTTMHIPSPIASVPFRSANGAASYQPGATPQGCVHSFHQGPTARPIPETIPPGTNRLAVAMGRAFSPRFVFDGLSWAVGPGWDGGAPLVLGNAAGARPRTNQRRLTSSPAGRGPR